MKWTDKSHKINRIMNSIFHISARKFDGQCSHGRGSRRLPRIRWTSYTTQPQVSSSRTYEFIASTCDVTKHVSNVNFFLLWSNLDPRISPVPCWSTTDGGAVKTLGSRLLLIWTKSINQKCRIVSFFCVPLCLSMQCYLASFFCVFVFFFLWYLFLVKKLRWLLPSLP